MPESGSLHPITLLLLCLSGVPVWLRDNIAGPTASPPPQTAPRHGNPAGIQPRGPKETRLRFVSQLSQEQPLRVQIEMAEGEQLQGDLLEIAEDKLIFRAEGTTQTLPVEELESITSQVSPLKSVETDSDALNLAIKLVDGSRCSASVISSDGAVLSLQVGSRELQFATDDVASVQFGALTAEQSAQWAEFQILDLTSDVLVVRQPSGALTKIEGIVLDLSEDAVGFDFGGQRVDVPKARLAGLLLYHAEMKPLASIQGELHDTLGATWKFSELETIGNEQNSRPQGFQLQLASGARLQILSEHFRRVNFSIGNRKFLAQLDPQRLSAKQLFDFPIDDLGEERIFGLHNVPALKLPGQNVGPSLKFVGGGEATYVIPEGFRLLKGAVKLAPSGNRTSSCGVEIFVEGKLVWSQSLPQVGQIQAFEIPVEGLQRLRLVVTSKSELPVGDVVYFIEPQLSK